jgi:hypothetical protein
MTESVSMTATKQVKCARCKVALEGPANPKPQDRFECPRCGVGDTYKRVMADVAAHAKEQMADATTRAFETAFRNSKNVKLTKGPRPHKAHRFIVDLDL